MNGATSPPYFSVTLYFGQYPKRSERKICLGEACSNLYEQFLNVKTTKNTLVIEVCVSYFIRPADPSPLSKRLFKMGWFTGLISKRKQPV